MAKKTKTRKIVLQFSEPPSANAMYAGYGKRRYKSQKYKDWIKKAEFELLSQEFYIIEGHYSLTLRVRRRRTKSGAIHKGKKDNHNYIKAVPDLLVKCGVIQDDCLQERTIIEWADDIDGIEVILEPVDSP